MKIAVFYPQGATAWSVAKGVSVVLTRMGHDVDEWSTREPLENHDLILVAGPEYLWRELSSIYSFWEDVKVPKIGWLHETVNRADYNTNPIALYGQLPVEALKRFTPLLYTQAHQDQHYGMKFVPCGVDTGMFFPKVRVGLKDVDNPIYSGSLYGIRQEFLRKHRNVRLKFAYREYATVEDYAEGLRSASAVFNFPSLSAMSTARVFEVLASRTALISPIMEGPENYSIFTHGKHLFYYTDSPDQAIAECAANGKFVCLEGYKEVTEKHTLEQRLTTMLGDL